MGLAPTGRSATKRIVIHRIVRRQDHRGVGWAMRQTWEQRLQKEMRERERVEQEIRVARSIQQASLPKEVPHWRAGRSLPTTSLLGR